MIKLECLRLMKERSVFMRSGAFAESFKRTAKIIFDERFRIG